MQDMRVSVGSDGVSYEYASAAEHCFHPRNFNTFPRFIQTAREMGILTPEQAVYKMTGLPASVLGLKDRGLIRLGMAADLTVLIGKRSVIPPPIWFRQSSRWALTMCSLKVSRL